MRVWGFEVVIPGVIDAFHVFAAEGVFEDGDEVVDGLCVELHKEGEDAGVGDDGVDVSKEEFEGGFVVVGEVRVCGAEDGGVVEEASQMAMMWP